MDCKYVPENIGVAKFLDISSLENHDEYCLSYVFAHRDFSDGVLGLAWIGDSKFYLYVMMIIIEYNDNHRIYNDNVMFKWTLKPDNTYDAESCAHVQLNIINVVCKKM